LNVGMTSGTLSLKGDTNKTAQITFINNSGFKLGQDQLKKIRLVYTTSHGKLTKGTQDVKGKNLWELLETELEVGDKKDKSLDFTIDNDGAAEVEFTKIKLNNSTYTDEIASIKWAGDLNVGMTSGTLSLKGDTNKTAQITFINNSGFKLGQDQLKKISLVYTTSHGKLTKGMQDVNGKNLWELLGTELEVGNKKDKSLDFTIDNDGAAEVEFTQIKLNNSTYTSEIASIKWEKVAEQLLIHIDTKDLRIGRNNKEIRVGFRIKRDYDREKLKNLKLAYTITGGALKQGRSEVENKSLWDVLGGDSVSSKHIVFNIEISGDPDSIELRDIQVVDENKNVVSNTIRKILWQKNIDIKMFMQPESGQNPQQLKGRWNTQFNIQFVNQTGLALTKEDLQHIKAKVEGITGDIKLRTINTEISHEVSLWDLLNIANERYKIENGETRMVNLFLDPGKQNADVNLKLTLEGVTNTDYTSLGVNWIDQPIKVKIAPATGVDLTALKGNDDLKVPVDITNESEFDFNAEILQLVKIHLGITNGSFIHFGIFDESAIDKSMPRDNNKIENQNTSLYDLLEKENLPAGRSKRVYLLLMPNKNSQEVNAILELDGSKSEKEEDRKVAIKWSKS
ncbi:MAG: hypothetical protein ACYC2U_08420, partial [Candidatus Amoebophilus sp.]